jgi:hypothetical protein
MSGESYLGGSARALLLNDSELTALFRCARGLQRTEAGVGHGAAIAQLYRNGNGSVRARFTPPGLAARSFEPTAR